MKYNTYTLDNGLRIIHLPSDSKVVYCHKLQVSTMEVTYSEVQDTCLYQTAVISITFYYLAEGVMYYDPAATGERIQNLRRDREVTQEQLAIDLNISDRYMRNLEKGEKVPSVDLFVELRERFGSSLDYIVLGVSASQREQELQDQLQMLRKELKEMQRRILVMLEILGESA